MLWFLIKIILGIPLSIILLFILVVVFREIVSHIHILYYISQDNQNGKMLIAATPSIVRMKRILENVKKYKDFMYGARANIKNEKALKADMMITKTYRDTSISIHPISDRCFTEFYQKELEYTTKFRSSNIDMLGFILLSGEKAMHQRAIFKEIFNFDRLKRTLPTLRNIVRTHMDELKKKIKTAPN